MLFWFVRSRQSTSEVRLNKSFESSSVVGRIEYSLASLADCIGGVAP